MSTLKEKAESILLEKNEKIIPENLPNDVTAFGVQGSIQRPEDGQGVGGSLRQFWYNQSANHIETQLSVAGVYPAIINNNNYVGVNIPDSMVAQTIGLTSEKIKKDETILGVTGTCAGKTMYDGYTLMGTDKITSTNTDFNVSYINVRQVEYGPNLEHTQVEYTIIICNLTNSNLRLSDYDFVLRFYDDTDNLIKSISLTGLYGMDGIDTMIYDHSNSTIHQHNQEFLTEYNWDSITKAQVDITPHN